MPPGVIATRLLAVGLTVATLDRAMAFYAGALGFVADGPPTPADPALARLLGAARLTRVRMRRGGQALELAVFDPPGAPYPPDSRSNDGWFQHCALPVADMGAACARLAGQGGTAISQGGPQRLPADAGGVVAFKFRDPDGHPLELIAFPGADAPRTGIDHSAISVADTARSVAFYRQRLGLRLGHQGLNHGPRQDALDGLGGVLVDVVSLLPECPSPHVELLGYRSPRGLPAPAKQPADIGASRLVFEARGLAGDAGAVTLADGARVALWHDPDGHALLLIEPPDQVAQATR